MNFCFHLALLGVISLCFSCVSGEEISNTLSSEKQKKWHVKEQEMENFTQKKHFLSQINNSLIFKNNIITYMQIMYKPQIKGLSHEIEIAKGYYTG
jgi:hypothetical protein